MPAPDAAPLHAGEAVAVALRADPRVRSVTLVGSRAGGTPTRLSDWDYEVRTDDDASVMADLRAILDPLRALGAQWDPFGGRPTFMVMLPGAVKVDVVFPDAEQPGTPDPWRVTAATLPAIEHHFWDWTLWLAGKRLAGRHELVAAELDRMWGHLLAPMGAPAPAATLEEAIAAFRAARDAREAELGVSLDRRLEREVLAALALD